MTPRPQQPLDIYLRISKDDENDEEGVRRQEREIKAELKRRGVKVGKIIVDNDTSATSGVAMPGRDEVYERMRSGVSGGVAVYHVKRLLRRIVDMEDLIVLVEGTKSQIVTLKSSDLDLSTASGRAVARIFATMGAMEVEELSERMKSYFADRAARGIPHGRGRRPFGWNDDWKTLHKTEAKLYRELFRSVIDGRSLTSIARDWEARGILNTKGKRLSIETLHQRIRAERAIGVAVYRGEPQGPGDWEPIVTPKVQQAALAALRSRRQRHLRMTGPQRAPRLLSSLIKCGAPGCDKVMRLVRSGDAVNYKCDEAGHGQIVCELAETEVEKRFLHRLRQPKTHAALERLRRRQPDTSALVDTVEQIQLEIDEYDADKAADRINRKRWLTLTEGATARLAEAKAKLAAAGDSPALLSMNPAETAQQWEKFDLDERRRRLAPWVNAVRVAPLNGSGGRNFRPERVSVDWRV